MPVISSQDFTLPRIEGGVSGQAALDMLNAPVEASEAALNTLSATLAGLTNRSGIVQKNAPMSADVFVGALVYFNTEPGHQRFEPALAVLEGIPGDQGQSVEAPSARVEGIVLSLDSSPDGSNTVAGTLLRGGYWESPAVMSGTLSGDRTPGIYYLSHLTPGKAVKDTAGHLRQGVLSYYGDGKFSMSLFYMAHDNHFHGSCTLVPAAWKPASLFDGDAPEGFALWYDASADPAASGLGELGENTAAVFADGLLQSMPGEFRVYGGALWHKGATPPAAGTAQLFNSYPFAYGSPVVRSIETTDDSALSVSSANGRVVLKPGDYVNSGSLVTGTAVSGIDGNRLSYTPVVTEVVPGPGMSVDSNPATGTAVVSSSSIIGTPLDAYNVNHNGTIVASSGSLLYFVYPRGRISSMVISLPFQGTSYSPGVRARVCLTGEGTGAAFGVTITFIPQPREGHPVSRADIREIGTVLNLPSGEITYAASQDGIVIPDAGILYAVITAASAPGEDIHLLRAGFIYEIA